MVYLKQSLMMHRKCSNPPSPFPKAFPGVGRSVTSDNGFYGKSKLGHTYHKQVRPPPRNYCTSSFSDQRAGLTASKIIFEIY
jgi:hypothetical protein